LKPAIAYSRLLVATLGALAVQGCTGFGTVFDSPKHTLNPEGPVSLRDTKPPYLLPSNISDTATATQGQVGAFELSYAIAYNDHINILTGRTRAPGNSDDTPSVNARNMAETGMALTDSFCAEFFLHSGRNQKWLDVGKDAIAVIGTLATGTLAIASPANSTAAAATALFTATAYNGVDLYTRNFLFGVDNIQQVSAMVQQLLATHKASALPQNDTSIWTFDGAVQVINDHQNICTVAAIRDKVLSAISGGQFKAYTPAGTGLTSPVTSTSTAAAQSVPDAANAATSTVPAASLTTTSATSAASASVAPAASAADTEAAEGAAIGAIQAKASAAAYPTALAALTALAPNLSPIQKQNAAQAIAGVIATAAANTAAMANAARPTSPPASRHIILRLQGGS
jgi:hypothetical protein